MGIRDRAPDQRERGITSMSAGSLAVNRMTNLHDTARDQAHRLKSTEARRGEDGALVTWPSSQIPHRARPATSLRLARQEGVTIYRKAPRILLTTRALERVDRRADPDTGESRLLQHLLPGCTRQTASNSSRP